VADVFDALTHVRPYKPAWPVSQALVEPRRQGGRQFDPDAVDAFMEFDDAALLASVDGPRPKASCRARTPRAGALDSGSSFEHPLEFGPDAVRWVSREGTIVLADHQTKLVFGPYTLAASRPADRAAGGGAFPSTPSEPPQAVLRGTRDTTDGRGPHPLRPAPDESEFPAEISLRGPSIFRLDGR
jgi:hypothetical protein